MENETHRNRHDLTSAERKQMPVYRGALKYFPDALMVVGMLSLRADRKHTPDADPDDLSRPQWVKGASADHGDCVARHQLDIEDMDPEVGLRYVAHVAWRANAQLQAYIEQRGIDAVVDWDWAPRTSEEAVAHAHTLEAVEAYLDDADTPTPFSELIRDEVVVDAQDATPVRDVVDPGHVCFSDKEYTRCTPEECGRRCDRSELSVDAPFDERTFCRQCGAEVGPDYDTVKEPAKYELLPSFLCADFDGGAFVGKCALEDPSRGRPSANPKACLDCECHAQLRKVVDDA